MRSTTIVHSAVTTLPTPTRRVLWNSGFNAVSVASAQATFRGRQSSRGRGLGGATVWRAKRLSRPPNRAKTCSAELGLCQVQALDVGREAHEKAAAGPK